jgi:hypothetical protein
VRRRLTAPGVPIIVEFVADQLTNLEQPVDLGLQQGPFQVRCVPRAAVLPADAPETIAAPDRRAGRRLGSSD